MTLRAVKETIYTGHSYMHRRLQKHIGKKVKEKQRLQKIRTGVTCQLLLGGCYSPVATCWSKCPTVLISRSARKKTSLVGVGVTYLVSFLKIFADCCWSD